jgi:hypothetical protein
MPEIKVLRTVGFRPSPDRDPAAPHLLSLWVDGKETMVADGLDDVTAFESLRTLMESEKCPDFDIRAANESFNVLIGKGNSPPGEDA